jgi:hypothetical protein
MSKAPETNKRQHTYHGQKSTQMFRYRKAHLGNKGTTTMRATQTEQGVAGSTWIHKYERTEVNKGAGSHRSGHAALEHKSGPHAR